MSRRRGGRQQTNKQRKQSRKDKGLISRDEHSDVPEPSALFMVEVKPSPPQTASERAAQINAEQRAWVAEDPENRWGAELVEDAVHWARSGVHTAAELDHLLAREAHQDVYKSVYGYRPRMVDYSKLTTEQIHQLIADLPDLPDEAT